LFTGIVQAVGSVVGVERSKGDLRLILHTADLDLADVDLGDSIAANGVCLTVVELTEQGFLADASIETMSLTTVGSWRAGTPVNYEKSLTLSSRLGGHLVSGHIDGQGQVLERYADGRSERFRVKAPAELARYIAQKGSVTVDGTSLTVNAVSGPEFELNIVPHTLENTIFENYQPGTMVNIEVDVIARYLERLLLAGGSGLEENSSLDALTKNLLAKR
jgi:riboflavin synthase